MDTGTVLFRSSDLLHPPTVQYPPQRQQGCSCHYGSLTNLHEEGEGGYEAVGVPPEFALSAACVYSFFCSFLLSFFLCRILDYNPVGGVLPDMKRVPGPAAGLPRGDRHHGRAGRARWASALPVRPPGPGSCSPCHDAEACSLASPCLPLMPCPGALCAALCDLYYVVLYCCVSEPYLLHCTALQCTGLCSTVLQLYRHVRFGTAV